MFRDRLRVGSVDATGEGIWGSIPQMKTPSQKGSPPSPEVIDYSVFLTSTGGHTHGLKALSLRFFARVLKK